MNRTYQTLYQKLRPVFSRSTWRTFGRYVGMGTKGNVSGVDDINSLADFIGTRASHVAQSSLYGYLRTRAGTRFPQLFENPDLLESINIAKWHIWLACVSDLCLFVGYLLKETQTSRQEDIRAVINKTLALIIEETGIPVDAGPSFTSGRDKVIQRVNTCDWSHNKDNDAIFSESPDALVYWAPIAHELKSRDEEIVINSIRFRWIEIRREARRLIDVQALLTTMNQPM